MAFGYLPERSIQRRLVKALIGAPNLIKRIQGRAILKALRLDAAGVCVDVGCGSGYLTYEIARHCWAVGLDPRAEEYTRRLAISDDMRRRVAYVCALGDPLPLADQSVDRVLLSEVLPMVVDPGPMLRECARVLKEGGLVLVVNGLDDVPAEIYARSRVVRLLIRRGKLPPDFVGYKAAFNRNTGAHETALFFEGELCRKFEEAGFVVREQANSFRRANTHMLFYLQMFLLLAGRKVHSPAFFLLYPLFVLVEALDRKSKGLGAIFVLEAA